MANLIKLNNFVEGDAVLPSTSHYGFVLCGWA